MLKFFVVVVDKKCMDKTTDEKISELVAELVQVKERLDKSEKQQDEMLVSIKTLEGKVEKNTESLTWQ